MKRTAYIAWMGSVAILFVSCGASIDDLCQKVADCTGQDEDIDECIKEGEELEDRADEVGCGSEFNDFVDCAHDTFECKGKDGGFDCDAEILSLGTCAGNVFEDDDDGPTSSCGVSCDGNGNCNCTAGPNSGQACCNEGTCEGITLDCNSSDCCG